MSHTLTFTVDVNENDDVIEQEICELLRSIFINAISLIDYNANNLATSEIKNNN